MALARRTAPALSLLALLALLAPLDVRATPPLDAAGFTRRYAEAAQKALPDGRVEIRGDLEVAIFAKGSKEPHRALLNNAYADYERSPEDIDSIVEDHLASALEWLDRRDDPKVARDRIVPVLKTRGVLDDPAVRKMDEGKRPFSEPFAGDLIVLYAEDTPRSIRYLSHRQLAEAGVLRDGGLRKLAVENLLALLPKIEVLGGKNGIYMLHADGNYEATLLLATSLLDKLPEVRGDLVVAVPARDVFVFTGSENAAGVAALRDLAAQLSAKGGHTLSPSLYVRRASGKIEEL
jgi:uncharacterized protein YtpQ (UPF0354 family)